MRNIIDAIWTFNLSLLEIALRTIVIYAVVLLGIRLTGKREVGQMASSPGSLLVRINCVRHLKEHIAHEELEQALREHGVSTNADVGIAVLEVDGSNSVLKKDELPSVVRPHHRIRFIVKNKS